MDQACLGNDRNQHARHEQCDAQSSCPNGSCSPDVYFQESAAVHLRQFNNLVYEGCFDEKPQSYRGETGAQSSIVPTLLMALGVKHKSSLLTQHLEIMLTYMPTPHRRFIRGARP